MSRITILTADRNADISAAYREIRKSFSDDVITYYLPELEVRFLHPAILVLHLKEETKKCIAEGKELFVVTYSEEAFVAMRCAISEYSYEGAELYFSVKDSNGVYNLIKDYIRDNGDYTCRSDLFDAWDDAIDELFGLELE